MDTPNPQRPKDSKLAFLENAVWKKGQEIITVLLMDDNGKRHRIGHVFLTYEDNKKVFIASDSKGKEQFPPCNNLYELKKQYLGIEQELAKKLRELLLEKGKEKSQEKGGQEKER